MEPTLTPAVATRWAKTRQMVALIALAIDDGSLPIVDDATDGGHGIDLVDLDGIAQLCEARYLHAEAARIRRWLTP